MKPAKPAMVLGSRPAIFKRKREPDAHTTPSKRLSRTSKPTPSTTPPTTKPHTTPSNHLSPQPTPHPARATAARTAKPAQPQPPPAPTADLAALKGFLPLPVQLYADGDGPSTAARYLYYRPHRPAGSEDEADVPADRTLLVVNVPFYYTATELTELFSCFGEVEEAVILSRPSQHQTPLLLAPLDQSVYETAAVSSGLDVWQPAPPHPYYRSARLIFTSATSITTALSLAHSTTPPLQPHIPPPPTQLYGLPRLHAHHTAMHPSDLPTLRTSINTFLAQFDTRQQDVLDAQHSAAQSDGWTLVGTRGRRGAGSGHRAVGGVAGEDEGRLDELRRREDKKRAAVVGSGFYRFQGAEKKQTQLVELRRRFDEDKAKIAAMKANRKFKPL